MRKFMIHNARIYSRCGAGPMTLEESRVVRVLAEAEGWALVRRKSAMPYACRVTQLSEVPR